MGMDQAWRSDQGGSFPCSKQSLHLNGKARSEAKFLGFSKVMPVSWIRKLLMSAEEVHAGQTDTCVSTGPVSKR